MLKSKLKKSHISKKEMLLYREDKELCKEKKEAMELAYRKTSKWEV